MMEINVVPVGTGDISVSHHVARALKVIKETRGISYELTAMGTIVTAPSTKALLELAGKVHEAVLGKDVERLVTTIKIDERKDREASIRDKVQAVRDV
jgi:uncharacterized protein (TIGR00106 family)